MVRFPLSRATGIGELMDDPGVALEELSANLRDLERVNRLFGGTHVILHHLRAMVRRAHSEDIEILDVATGGADIPVAIVRWARRRGLRVRIVGMDQNPQAVRVAKERVRDYPEIGLDQADARALRYPAGSFDVVLCSLALHHFDYGDGVNLLASLDRIGRMGFIVNDLLRSWHAYVLTWLGMRLFCRGRLVRHDGPLSIRRAYTRSEFWRMVEDAGVSGVRMQRHAFFRVALVKEHVHGGPPHR